jgi:hypothetical protein
LVVVAGILVLMVGHGVTSFLCQRVESLGIAILDPLSSYREGWGWWGW